MGAFLAVSLSILILIVVTKLARNYRQHWDVVGIEPGAAQSVRPAGVAGAGAGFLVLALLSLLYLGLTRWAWLG